MSFNHTLSAILRGRWLIDKQWADEHILMVIGILKGQSLNVLNASEIRSDKGIKSFIGQSPDQGIQQPFIIDPITLQTYCAYVWISGQGYVPNPNIPPNSVAVIQVTGPITKYDGNCYEPGAITLAKYINNMNSRENVGSIILVLDTPGGESRAANVITEAIKNSQKPILSYIDGMCASLGVYLSAGTREVYLSSNVDQIGSVGSFCTLWDFSAYLQQQGIKIHEIYAPQSEDKNKDYRDALKGDYTAIQVDLKIHVDNFIKYVCTGGNSARANTASANVNEWSTGKMFYAAEAVKVGLADGVKPFTQVVSKAAWLGKRPSKLALN